MSETNMAVCRRWIEEGINKGNLAVTNEIFSADYVWHGPGGHEFRGPAGVREMMGMYQTAFPGFQITVDEMFAAGDKVVTRWSVRGTHNGEFMGIAPTKKEVTVSGINISQLEGGKVCAEWESFDELSMMQQIGAVPALAQAGG